MTFVFIHATMPPERSEGSPCNGIIFKVTIDTNHSIQGSVLAQLVQVNERWFYQKLWIFMQPRLITIKKHQKQEIFFGST
jgi:hypothetical protein